MNAPHKLAALVAIPLLLLTASGCGSEPSAENPTTTAVEDLTALPDIELDTELAAKVPADIKSEGLTVATSSNIPPMTFVDEDNSTLVGLDIDMSKAIGQRLGIEMDIQTAGFDTIIPGLQAERYDLALSSLGVTVERQETVDFVSYYNGGQGFLASADSDFAVEEIEDLCGFRVAVQSGSLQQTTLEDSLENCKAAGKEPYTIDIFSDHNAAVFAIQGGQADALYASISIVKYTAAENPKFRVAGVYKRSLVGAAFPKGSPLVPVVQEAVQGLMDDGTYKQILDKWGIASNAIEKSEINSAKPAK